MSINISVFGEKEKRVELAKALAKKDSEADLSYYSNVLGGKVVSVIEPTLFPEKLQPAAFAAFLSDYCAIVADSPTKELAETIVLLDLLEKKGGCIVTQTGIEKFLQKTSLNGYDVFSSMEECRDKIFSLQRDERRDALPLRCAIDSSFEVKGVGNVALGVVKSGVLRVHDELDAQPAGKKIGVKSIQVHDVDVKEAVAGDRFGISFKNATVEEVSRGTLLQRGGEVAKEATATIRVSSFAGQPIEENESLHACVGLQFIGCRIAQECKAGEQKSVDIVFEKEVALQKEPALLCRLNSKGNRAVASLSF